MIAVCVCAIHQRGETEQIKSPKANKSLRAAAHERTDTLTSFQEGVRHTRVRGTVKNAEVDLHLDDNERHLL